MLDNPLMESLFGPMTQTVDEWPSDPVGKARIFNGTTRVEYRLKYPLEPTPLSYHDGDVDKIVDAIVHFIKRVRDSHVHILAALRRFFWAIRVISAASRRRSQRNRQLVTYFADWWTSREEGLREEYHAKLQSANYRIHHTIEDSMAEFKRTCTPLPMKEEVVRTLIYRRRMEYLRKRRQWRLEFRAKSEHLRKLKHLYGTVFSMSSKRSQQSDDHLSAIREARKQATMCALQAPTLIMSERNVSLEQLLHITAEIERKHSKRDRAIVLSEWEQERAIEKERKRQFFVELALKREAERRRVTNDRHRGVGPGIHGDGEGGGHSARALNNSMQVDLSDHEDLGVAPERSSRRFTTIFFEEVDADTLRGSKLAQVATRRTMDGRRPVARFSTTSTALDLSVMSASDHSASAAVSPVVVRRKANPTNPLALSAGSMAAASAAALAKGASGSVGSPDGPRRESPRLLMSLVSNTSTSLGAQSNATSGVAAAVSNDRIRAEQAATAALAARRKAEETERLRQEVASRPPPPELPKFFSAQRAPAVTVHTVSNIHLGNTTRARPLDFDIASDGRVVDRRTAQSRHQYRIHRFLAPVTDVVETSFGKIRLALYAPSRSVLRRRPLHSEPVARRPPAR
jgi:hypothetical protein